MQGAGYVGRWQTPDNSRTKFLDSVRGKKTMRVSRFARALMFLLTVDLAGCGRGSQQGSAANPKEAGKIIGASIRQAHEFKAQKPGGRTTGDFMKKGRFRAKSGP
jgi:hypothetical protein